MFSLETSFRCWYWNGRLCAVGIGTWKFLCHTALSAFGFFYGGFGAIITAFFGVKEAYGDDTVGYNNSLGFFVMWAMLNLFFLFGSLPINLVYIGIFFFVELAASYFATADGYPGAATALQKAGGVFAFLAGLLGYYTVAHLMCQTALFFGFQWGIQVSIS